MMYHVVCDFYLEEMRFWLEAGMWLQPYDLDADQLEWLVAEGVLVEEDENAPLMPEPEAGEEPAAMDEFEDE
jgi:hypothetical protein